MDPRGLWRRGRARTRRGLAGTEATHGARRGFAGTGVTQDAREEAAASDRLHSASGPSG
ncbi:hypothetical protein Y09_1948 [Brachybacterium sp. SW0106-09]|nr:hypothetical protein Y09_1948 [Brachybacterium sp. SW0106-09]